MKRRTWLQLSAALLAGCKKSTQSPGATIKAGPFSVAVPSDWAKSAIIEKIPIRPVYGTEDWAAFRADPAYALKPEYGNRPQHWALRFPAAAVPGQPFDAAEAGDDPVAPQILIHKADEWEVAFADGAHEEHPRAETINGLRLELEAGRAEDAEVQSPAFMDASLDFVALKKELAFGGGAGIRLVGQWTWEPDLIRRGRLHYLFIGLSDDGTCQIIATFPLDHAELPSEAVDVEHLGYSVDRYEELGRGIAAYRSEAKEWIRQRADSFSPSLEALDGIIQSLNAGGWSEGVTASS
jgi:hypothetical protein